MSLLGPGTDFNPAPTPFLVGSCRAGDQRRLTYPAPAAGNSLGHGDGGSSDLTSLATRHATRTMRIAAPISIPTSGRGGSSGW